VTLVAWTEIKKNEKCEPGNSQQKIRKMRFEGETAFSMIIFSTTMMN